MSSSGLHDQIASLPTAPGVYVFKDVAGTPIYVGKALSLRHRVRQYFQRGHALEARIQAMVKRIDALDFIVTDSEVEALVLESNLIKRHHPYYNVRLRDDKKYPYLKVTVNERFPRVMVVRDIEADGARYFGPYTSTYPLWQTIRLLRRTFGICQVSRIVVHRMVGCGWDQTKGPRRRACLNYDIKQCLAPCVGKIDAEAYRERVNEALLCLEGKCDYLVEQLRERMESASARLDFEVAARLRDQIQALDQITEKQKVAWPQLIDVDVLGDHLREDAGCVSVSQVRRGKLIGQENFMLDSVSGLPEEQIVTDFVKQYYQRTGYVPPAIWLPTPLTESTVIQAWLRERRGGVVRLLVPRRGERRRLVELAAENARHHLEEYLSRQGSDERRAREALSELAATVGLPLPPRRIEAFDISTLFGREAVGSMVVFVDGRPKRSDYRRFRIRLDAGKTDDYAMMREVLERRLGAALTRREKFIHLPDLLLVDGGKGQLGVAVDALAEVGLNLPVVALAKQHEELFLPDRSAPILLPRHSRALHLIQQVRDEAHRFAVSYHRQLRDRKVRESVLDEIPGIGPRRRTALLRRFGSVVGIGRASMDELVAVPGMNRTAAEAVEAALRAGREGEDA